MKRDPDVCVKRSLASGQTMHHKWVLDADNVATCEVCGKGTQEKDGD